MNYASQLPSDIYKKHWTKVSIAENKSVSLITQTDAISKIIVAYDSVGRYQFQSYYGSDRHAAFQFWFELPADATFMALKLGAQYEI